ncbi:MAG: MBL fold metallo-hydrolase [candidate division Zixibacteria bacterium]|nr:MBL fold metallo-hydrolase [candidate division Zixibacteria bacterium]
MAKISFHGAAGTVTGSRHLLEINGHRLLIDCGMFQGRKKNRLKNWEVFPVTPSSIDRVLLTHAHIDHAGYLPRLVKNGFNGKVHCTHPTQELCDILLRDSAYLQEEDARWANKKGYSKHKPARPLYVVDDAKAAMKLFEPVHYGDELFLDDDTRVIFHDAGHLLGSSFIGIQSKKNGVNKKILFSGDIGRSGRPLLQDPVQVYNVDYLVLESTYGNRLHGQESPIEELVRVIIESKERGGVLVIPAFSVGRTQAILYVLRELEEQKKIPSMPVYVDSPMAINAVEVFENHIGALDLDSKLAALAGKKIIRPSQLKLTRTRQESKSINQIEKNAIIISASGMAVGGRILHHLVHRLSDPRNTILIIGYQAMGTRGRRILEGEKKIKIHGRMFDVNAKVESITGFSGHADYNEILAWMMGFNKPPKKVFLVHGEPDAQEYMANEIKKTFNWETVIPAQGDSFEIDM